MLEWLPDQKYILTPRFQERSRLHAPLCSPSLVRLRSQHRRPQELPCRFKHTLFAHIDRSSDDLVQQIDSITPGHPEVLDTPGIEVTTGPLGQGFSNAVGLAIAQSHSAAYFNKPGFDLFNNYTYTFFGDGCAQEGVASEAASMAGHLQLGNLIAIYDDNHISIGEQNRAHLPPPDQLLTQQ